MRMNVGRFTRLTNALCSTGIRDGWSYCLNVTHTPTGLSFFKIGVTSKCTMRGRYPPSVYSDFCISTEGAWRMSNQDAYLVEQQLISDLGDSLGQPAALADEFHITESFTDPDLIDIVIAVANEFGEPRVS